MKVGIFTVLVYDNQNNFWIPVKLFKTYIPKININISSRSHNVLINY